MVNGKVPINSDTAILPINNSISEANIKVLIVDDSHSIRESLRYHLESEPNLEIVGSVDNAQDALKQVKALKPNIVMMDIEMPGMDGIEGTEAILKLNIATKVIILSSHFQEEYLKKALNAGAKGYLLKNSPTEELAHGIKFVHQGYLHFSPGLCTKIASASDSSALVVATSNKIKPHNWSSQTKELIDTVPRVWTRGLLYFLGIFAAVALPWAMFSKVDETGTAKGRLEPSGKSFVLDASVAGTVAKIHVKEGEVVKAGQNLVELESKLVSAELNQLKNQLEGQENRLYQLELLKQQLLLVVNTQELENQGQKLEKQSQVAQARQQLQFLQNAYDLQKQEKLAQVNQAKQNVVYGQTAYNSAEAIYRKAKKEIERYRNALRQGIISEVQVVEQENLLADRQQRYEQAKSDMQQAKLRLAEQESSYSKVLRQAKSDIEQAQLQLQEQQKSYQTMNHTGKLAVLRSKEQLKNLETEITTLTVEISQTQSQIASSEYQLEQHIFKAPVSGTIFNLPINKSGEVVQPGDEIAEIAMEDSPLIVRAQMATTESGSLTPGMSVKLKLDAYPFQDFGIVRAELVKISPTSKLTDTPQGQVANYDLEIKLERDCLPTANQCIPFRPGDTATAEVIVRQRRVIDFILDPFKKLQKGGLHL